jgi:hypothetical protein
MTAEGAPDPNSGTWESTTPRIQLHKITPLQRTMEWEQKHNPVGIEAHPYPSKIKNSTVKL